MPKVLILGVGSPFGDDRLGWVAAQAVENSPVVAACAEDVIVRALDRPGAGLVREWSDTDRLILLDAVRTGAMPGSMHRLTGDRIASWRAGATSHGIGVAEALALAGGLGELPERVVLLGLEADAAHNGDGLSPAVAAALPQLVRAVEREVGRLLRDA